MTSISSISSISILAHAYYIHTVLEHDLEMVDNSPQLKRAKCIPDAEWDAWRERLVTLYLKDELSRKDIVDTIAKEHKFKIT